MRIKRAVLPLPNNLTAICDLLHKNVNKWVSVLWAKHYLPSVCHPFMINGMPYERIGFPVQKNSQPFEWLLLSVRKISSSIQMAEVTRSKKYSPIQMAKAIHSEKTVICLNG